MPPVVAKVLFGSIASLFINECLYACTEVSTGVEHIIMMLTHVSYGNTNFSKMLAFAVMHKYNTVNSGELKHLSTIIVDLLVKIHTCWHFKFQFHLYNFISAVR